MHATVVQSTAKSRQECRESCLWTSVGIVTAPAAIACNGTDPDDEPFLEVAIEGKSEILVTGNKIHYPMKYRKGIKVLSPTEFIKFYQKIKDSAEHHV